MTIPAQILTVPTLTVEHPLERTVLRALVGVALACAIAYVYLIGASTFHIIARKQAEISMVAAQGTLTQLNTEYYQLSGQITPAYAAAIGLAPVAQKDYVTRSVHLGYAAGPLSR